MGGKNQSMDCFKFEWPIEHLRDCFPPDKWHLACSTIQSYLTGISFWYELGAEAAINRCHTFRRGLDHSSHAIYKLWWFLDFMYVLCLCNEEKKSGCTNVWLQKYFKVIINMYIYKIEFFVGISLAMTGLCCLLFVECFEYLYCMDSILRQRRPIPFCMSIQMFYGSLLNFT